VPSAITIRRFDARAGRVRSRGFPPRVLPAPFECERVAGRVQGIPLKQLQFSCVSRPEGRDDLVTADRQVRSARILALLFCSAGAVAIVLGWNATAERASSTSQLPYLLSGGAAGIGLLTFGVGLLLIAQLRGERRRVIGVLDLMGPSVVERARASLTTARASTNTDAAAPDAGDDHRGDDRMSLPMRGAKVVALVLAVAGFAMIVLGWSGMTNATTTDAQLPYVLSGGFGGVALIVFSVGLLMVAQIRTERRKLTDVLAVRAAAVGQTASASTPAPTATPARAPAAAPQAPAAPEDPAGSVVAGASTYHRPDCRLAQGTSGLRGTSAEAAKSSNLTPCRVCDPDGAADGASTSESAAAEPAAV
jgi:hypothetical protein